MGMRERLQAVSGGMADLSPECAQLWRSSMLPEVAFFSASFRDFAYRPHIHEEYAIGVIEQGAQRFRYRGGSYVAAPGTVIALNPDEVHDAQAETESGYRYRMMYLNPAWVEEILAVVSPQERGLRFFSMPRFQDLLLAREIQQVLRLWDQDAPGLLEAEGRLVQAVGALFGRHGESRGVVPAATYPTMMARVCDYLRVHAAEALSLEVLAQQAGLSRYHFLRVFKATTGLAPHAYLIQVRVGLARQAIERGEPLGQAALLAGFADQSHLTLHFKATYGVTPGQYQRGWCR